MLCTLFTLIIHVHDINHCLSVMKILQKLVIPLKRKRKQDSEYVRPGAAGLLIGIECSRVRKSKWMYLTSFVTTRIGVELAAVQRKLPDCVAVGFQMYSARTFHVPMSPRIYKGGQGPPPNNQHLRQNKPHRTLGITQTRGMNLSKSLCSLYLRVP